jgi:predicted glycosyltransferase/glycosyltransferase involved in cell wall biosynthesis
MYTPGGAQGYALELYHGMRESDEFEPIFLARTDNEVASVPSHIGTPFRSVADDPNQFLFYTIPDNYDGFNLSLLTKEIYTDPYRQFLRDIRPDLVHFQHTQWLGIDILRETRNTLPHVPIVHTLHEFLPICHRHGQMLRTGQLGLCDHASPDRCHECFPTFSSDDFFRRKRFIQSQLSVVDQFIAPSRFLLERYVEWGIPRDKILYQDNGRQPVVRLEESRTTTVHDRLGYFGQINPYKGLDVLLDAMLILKKDADRARRFHWLKGLIGKTNGEDDHIAGGNAHLSIHGANLEFQREDYQYEIYEKIKAARRSVTMTGPYVAADLPRLMSAIDWAEAVHSLARVTLVQLDHAGFSVETVPMSSTRARVLFYCHDGLGLGHLRLTLAIATEFAQRRPDATLLSLTGSPHVHDFKLPANLDTVKMPAIDKRRLFYGEPDAATDPRAPEDIFVLRESIIDATVNAFAPHLVLVDHEAAGLAGEFIPALTLLRAMTPQPTLVLGLRDITYGPEETRDRWLSDGVYDLLDQTYDHILVYGSRDVFDAVSVYGFSPAAAAKTTFTGHIRQLPQTAPATIRAQLNARESPLAVVTVGGGSNGAELIHTYLEAVRGGALAGFNSFVVTGPQLSEAEQSDLALAAANLPGLTLVPFCTDMVSYLAAADVVVTMGGYNAVCEAVGAGKRPIVVPRIGGSQEQMVRAERFAELGLVTSLHPRELTAERLATAVLTEFKAGITREPILDFGGLERAGDVLVAALRN